MFEVSKIMSSGSQNKIKMSSYYNNKYTIDNHIKLKNKRELAKRLSINNDLNNLNRNFNKYKKSHKNNSCCDISISPKKIEKGKKKKLNDLNDEDKLIIKTSFIKTKNEKIKNNNMNENDKYHINFELLSNAGINNDISINLTFI